MVLKVPGPSQTGVDEALENVEVMVDSKFGGCWGNGLVG